MGGVSPCIFVSHSPNYLHDEGRQHMMNQMKKKKEIKSHNLFTISISTHTKPLADVMAAKRLFLRDSSLEYEGKMSWKKQVWERGS